MPQRTLMCLRRTVDTAGAEALGKEFVAIIRRRPLPPRLPGRAGAPFAIYYGEVSQEVQGPVEWCYPLAADQAAEAARFPELTLRTEAAHEEAFVSLGDVTARPPRWELVSRILQGWADERQRQPCELSSRVTLLVKPPVTEHSVPDCDFALPLR
jgi:hypothetical protein